MSQRTLGQLVLGAVVLLAGVTLLLDRMDVVTAGSIWSVFWPLLVTALGVASFLVAPRAWVGPLLVTALGVYWLLEAFDVVHVSAWTYLLPVAVIVLGLSILVASTSRAIDADHVTALVFLWGTERRSVSQRFRSAGLTSIVGGITLDLRAADIAGRARVDAFTLFGGVDVKVPPTWHVSVTGLPVLGGYTDRTTPPADPAAPVLDVRAVSIFGGVTIKPGAAAPPVTPPGQYPPPGPYASPYPQGLYPSAPYPQGPYPGQFPTGQVPPPGPYAPPYPPQGPYPAPPAS